jgi:hypothetical protein
VRVATIFNNQAISESFTNTEIGLLAHGEDNTEILYSVIYFGETADIIPSASNLIIEKIITAATAVGIADNITADARYSFLSSLFQCK